jgi:hypothetical protein
VPNTPSAFESFLNLPSWLLVLIIGVPAAAIMLACIKFYRRQEQDQPSYPLASTTVSIIGGAFIFVGSKANRHVPHVNGTRWREYRTQ